MRTRWQREYEKQDRKKLGAHDLHSNSEDVHLSHEPKRDSVGSLVLVVESGAITNRHINLPIRSVPESVGRDKSGGAGPGRHARRPCGGFEVTDKWWPQNSQA